MKRRLDDGEGQSSGNEPKPTTYHDGIRPVTVQQCSVKGHRRSVNLHSLDSYTRHKMLINYYALTHPDSVARVFTRDSSTDRNDYDVLLANHRFIWSEDFDSTELTWGQRVAKKYYDKLFKEYCIVDLSRFEENQFGMRWRTEKEVVEGKGQFVCGAKRCPVRGGLASWEVLFAYREQGERHSALVKLRLCPECSRKLNYHRQHRKAKRCKRQSKSQEDKPEDTSVPVVAQVKEEIATDDETEMVDKSYEELIEKIWRQPVKADPDDDTEQALENDVDEYLNQLFL